MCTQMLDLYWHMECGAYATLTFQHSILPVDSTTFGDDSDFPWHTVIIQYFSWYFFVWYFGFGVVFLGLFDDEYDCW